MKAEYVNAQRAAILDLHAKGTAPADIAVELGCALATVYKVIADPTPDKRGSHGPRPSKVYQRHLANIKRLANQDPTLSPAEIYAVLAERHDPTADPPLPSLPSIARHLEQLQQYLE